MVFKEVIKKFSVLEYKEQNTEYTLKTAIKFDFLNNLDTHYDNLVHSSSLTLVNINLITTEAGTSFENTTAFCLNKSVFEQYI